MGSDFVGVNLTPKKTPSSLRGGQFCYCSSFLEIFSVRMKKHFCLSLQSSKQVLQKFMCHRIKQGEDREMWSIGFTNPVQTLTAYGLLSIARILVCACLKQLNPEEFLARDMACIILVLLIPVLYVSICFLPFQKLLLKVIRPCKTSWRPLDLLKNFA